jgi:hypothetical protein
LQNVKLHAEGATINLRGADFHQLEQLLVEAGLRASRLNASTRS